VGPGCLVVKENEPELEGRQGLFEGIVAFQVLRKEEGRLAKSGGAEAQTHQDHDQESHKKAWNVGKGGVCEGGNAQKRGDRHNRTKPGLEKERREGSRRSGEEKKGKARTGAGNKEAKKAGGRIFVEGRK